MKLKKIHLFLIPIFIFANISFLYVPFASPTTLPNEIVYSWSETTYSIDHITIWDETPQIMEYSGMDSYITNYTYSYDLNSTHYREITHTGEYFTQYEYFNNMSITGNMTNRLDMNVYRVDISYDNNNDGVVDLQLIWMAVKDATWYIDDWITEQTDYYNYTNNNYHNYTEITKVRNKINNTIESIFIERDKGWNNYSFVGEFAGDSGYIQHASYSVNFTIPIILTMQIYSTETGATVAWADMFYNYILYDDIDHDGIYSAGEATAFSSPYNMFTSDEFMGMMMPAALEYSGFITIFDTNSKIDMFFPFDKSISEISSGIIFYPPTAGSENDISWSIEYPEFPTYAIVMEPNLYTPSFNGSYAKSSPGNYSYGFNYTIGSNKADLDITINLSKISNSTLYNATQGLGLSLPHYSYFMSSTMVQSGVNSMISKPENLHSFFIGSTSIAEINMIKPAKKNYTLYDYPNIGVDTSYESIGATVSKIATSADEQNYSPMSGSDPFTSIVFSLEDFVADNPKFDNSESYYTITTQNYPIWSGNKLVHDPTLTAFYSSASGTPDGAQIIDGYIFIPLIFLSAIPIVLLVSKKRKKEDRNT